MRRRLCVTAWLAGMAIAEPTALAQSAAASIGGSAIPTGNDRGRFDVSAFPGRQNRRSGDDGRRITANRLAGSGTQTIAGVDVVTSNAGAAIGGHVTDAASSPVSSYSVVVFPADRTKWFVTSRLLRVVRPSQDGSFEVTGLPPGEYLVAATVLTEGDDVSGDTITSDTLERLSFRATRLTLVEKQRFMTVLRLIPR